MTNEALMEWYSSILSHRGYKLPQWLLRSINFYFIVRQTRLKLKNTAVILIQYDKQYLKLMELFVYLTQDENETYCIVQ